MSRRFRPDVEGLRAVAIVLVVLFHAGLRGLGGGYVGVDVFFVISGFVITGVLLREGGETGRVSLAAFYARRARRIIPAATLVIVATVVATYVVLGAVTGNQTADDARWASLFFANFHFAAEGINYLTARQAPSPLQHFWSLAVEEQFYFVYPTLFLAVGSLRIRLTLRRRLGAALVGVVVVSFLWSIAETRADPAAAYFSPFTRGWELAVGALIAIGAPMLAKLPQWSARCMAWSGLGAIIFAAHFFNGGTSYPGFWASVPVVGTALIIAGGTGALRWGPELVLGSTPLAWLGKRSYSLYLWHWPILMLAAEAANRAALPFASNLPWLVVALAVSALSYRLIENPIRHGAFSVARGRRSLALGVVLIAGSVGMATFQLDAHAAPSTAPELTLPTSSDATSVAAVLRTIRLAPTVHRLPATISPPLGDVQADWGGSDRVMLAFRRRSEHPAMRLR